MDTIEGEIFGKIKIPPAHLKSEPNLALVIDNANQLKQGSFLNLRASQQRRSIAVSNNNDDPEMGHNESDLPDFKKSRSPFSPAGSISLHQKRLSVNSSNSRFSAMTPFNKSQAGTVSNI